MGINKDTRMDNELVQKALWNFAIPLALLYAAYYVYEAVTKYASSLWVEGGPNEWILVMRGGNMVKAAIGLKTFIGPFDQIARFPAKIHRVSFRTEQVT